jgi:ankyrin repeat protein
VGFQVNIASRKYSCDTHIYKGRGVLTNAQNKQHNTALHLACYSGNLEVAHMLLDLGANVDKRNEEGETPLHLVSRGKYKYQELGAGIARLLMERGVDVQAKDKTKHTALHSASFHGRLEIAKILLDHGAIANVESEQGETPLHLVSRGEYESQEQGASITRLLLKCGVDVHIQDKTHHTALHLAAFRGRLGIAREFLSHGAHVNVVNEEGETSFHVVI